MIEEWKRIEGYPNYSVSNLGRVCNNKTRRFLKPGKCGKRGNYYHVILYSDSHASRKSHSIHRLVAQAFIQNPGNKPEVNHLDGNGHNNAVSNLEWVSHKENITHAREVLHRNIGGSIGGSGADNGHSKRVIRVEDGLIFDTVIEAAQACGSNAYSGISHCLSGRRQTAFGYHWRYMEV